MTATPLQVDEQRRDPNRSLIGFPVAPGIREWLGAHLLGPAVNQPQSGGYFVGGSFQGGGGGNGSVTVTGNTSNAGNTIGGLSNSGYNPSAWYGSAYGSGTGYSLPAGAGSFGVTTGTGAGALGAAGATGGAAVPTTAGATTGGFSWSRLGQAGLGALASYFDSQAAQDASRNAGQINMTNSPWGPSEPYRMAGMERALALLGQPQQQYRGGGAGGGNRGSGGQSSAIAGALADRATGGHELYDPSNNFVTSLLGGQDTNPYRADLYQQLSGGLTDPYLDQFLQSNLSAIQAGPGGAGGSGGRAININYGGGGGGGAAQPADQIGAAGYIQRILDGQYLNDNPHTQALLDSITQNFQETEIPGISAEFSGAGRYGSGAYGTALGRAGEGLANSLAGVQYENYNARMGDVMTALGLGTEYDLTQQQLAEQAAGRGAAGAAGAASLQAQMQNAAAERASQEWMARLGAMNPALGLRSGLTQFGLGGQMDLAGGMSQDQAYALGLVPELSGLDIRDLTAAFGPNMQLDQLAQQQSNSAYNRWRDQQDQPWRQLGIYSDILGSLSGGYGTQQGMDARGQQPYGGNPWTQAAMGGIASYFGTRPAQQGA